VVDPDEEQEIYDYFKEADDDNIRKAMDELGEDYYDEMHVRLVRLKFHCDLGN
jgi:ATP-dependent DNA helicase RecQ